MPTPGSSHDMLRYSIRVCITFLLLLFYLVPRLSLLSIWRDVFLLPAFHLLWCSSCLVVLRSASFPLLPSAPDFSRESHRDDQQLFPLSHLHTLPPTSFRVLFPLVLIHASHPLPTHFSPPIILSLEGSIYTCPSHPNYDHPRPSFFTTLPSFFLSLISHV